jgi:hypothetical protein
MEFIRKQREEAVEAFTECGKHLQKFGDELFWEAMRGLGVAKPPCVKANEGYTLRLNGNPISKPKEKNNNKRLRVIPSVEEFKTGYKLKDDGTFDTIVRKSYNGKPDYELIPNSPLGNGEVKVSLSVPKHNNKGIPLSYAIWVLYFDMDRWPVGMNWEPGSEDNHDGSAIIHLDGNRLNNNPDNLKEYDPQEDSQWLYNQTVV